MDPTATPQTPEQASPAASPSKRKKTADTDVEPGQSDHASNNNSNNNNNNSADPTTPVGLPSIDTSYVCTSCTPTHVLSLSAGNRSVPRAPSSSRTATHSPSCPLRTLHRLPSTSAAPLPSFVIGIPNHHFFCVLQLTHTTHRRPPDPPDLPSYVVKVRPSDSFNTCTHTPHRNFRMASQSCR